MRRDLLVLPRPRPRTTRRPVPFRTIRHVRTPQRRSAPTHCRRELGLAADLRDRAEFPLVQLAEPRLYRVRRGSVATIAPTRFAIPRAGANDASARRRAEARND